MSPARVPTDAQLAERIRLGDEEALDLLMQQYHPALQVFVARYVGPADAADDVLQDVFVRLWQTRATIDSTQSLRSYLYRMARNVALNATIADSARRRREEHFAAERGDVTAADLDIEQAEFQHAIHRAVEALPERCREIFILARQHGLSYPEVANVLGVTTGTVKTQMARAMASLVRQLAPFLVLALAAR